MQEAKGSSPVTIETKIETTYPATDFGQSLKWNGTAWSAKSDFDAVLYYTDVDQYGSAWAYLGPLVREAGNGRYTVNKSVRDSNTISTYVTGNDNLFKAIAAGTYLIDFSIKVEISSSGATPIINLVVNTAGGNAFSSPSSTTEVARVSSPGTSKMTLCGKVVIDLVANSTFGFVLSESTRQTTYGNATLIIKRIL